MAAKTLATYISELSAGSSIGAGDKFPALESSTMVYFDGASIGGGGITALTGDVTASGTGSVVASIATGVIVNADVNASAAIDATKIADGSVSSTEFQYLNGVTSAIQTQLDAKVDENGAIVAATKTKITYDTKGLVTAGADATTADIADSLDRRYVTDAQLVVIGNTSGTNTGNQTITNSSDATSHTVTLSASGGSVQLVEGSGITLTTTGTGSAGIVTIAASGGATEITGTITGIDPVDITIYSGVGTSAICLKILAIFKCTVAGAGTVAVNEAYSQNYENVLFADGVFDGKDSGFQLATDNMGDALFEPYTVSAGNAVASFTPPTLAAADTQIQYLIRIDAILI